MASTPARRESSQGPVDVLVTGAAGFIGAALVAGLDAAGHTVVGADIRPAPGCTALDVTNGAMVESALGRLRPRVVVHAAAIVDDRGAPALFEAVNVGGTRNVLRAAARHDVQRFVHISSIAALGFDPGCDADETSPLIDTTGSPYFDTKARSERLVREAFTNGQLAGVIVRPGDVWGPDSLMWVDRPLEIMSGPLPILIGGGRGLIAHCWRDNLVDGIALAVDHPRAVGGIYTFHDGSKTTEIRDYLGRLAIAAGRPAPRRSIPYGVAFGLAAALEGLHRVTGITPQVTRGALRYVCRRATYSIDRSQTELGYRPRVDLDAGMNQLAERFAAR